MNNLNPLVPAFIEPRPARKYRLVETRARRGAATSWLAILELPNGNGATLYSGPYSVALETLNLVLVPGDEYQIQNLNGATVLVAITGNMPAWAVS